MKRRDFLSTTAGAAVGATVLTNPVSATVSGAAKRKVVLVGTGSRGTSFWGKRIVANYSDIVEFVGLCDINPGRLKLAKEYMGVDCPVFSDFDEIFFQKNFEREHEMIKVESTRGGHGGGDTRLQDKIFRDPEMADPYKHAASSRDGVMSSIIGIAARKSIDENRMVRIEELTSIKPHPTKGA